MNNPQIDRDKKPDVSITDLIAEARLWAPCAMTPESQKSLLVRLATALEAVTVPTESADRKALTAIRDAYEVAMEIRLTNDDDEFYVAVGEALNRVVDSDGNFMAVTVPTENEREELAKDIAGWIRDGVFEGRDAGESLYPVSERISARILAALPVPVEPECDPEENADLIEWNRNLAEWERENGSIDNAERHEATANALSRLSQPVQVELTDEIVEKAARAIFAAMRTSHPLSSMADYDDPAYEYTKNACKRDARAALEAALGGGDHE